MGTEPVWLIGSPRQGSAVTASVPGCPSDRRVVDVMSCGEFIVGEYRRYVRLGTVAVYRVCGWEDEAVEVEVVSAPGLEPGLRFRFTAEAVRAMVRLGPSDLGQIPEER